MNREITLFVSACVVFVISFLLITLWLVKLRRTYQQLNQMLDEAIAGEFQEKRYDESMMSKLSVKLKQFLNSSQLSRNKINQEKEAIKSLVSDISHQTKIPITNILLYLQLLSEEEKLPPECRDNLELIKKQSEKLDFLIQALVKTSRMETGIITIKPKYGLLNDAVLSALEQVRFKAINKNISVIYLIEHDYYATFDLKWTIEAISNVFDNAIKYTDQGGTITLLLQEYELFVRLDVIDTGMGIPEDELNKVFQRFYRGRKVSRQDGVGIGLYLAREIIMKQSGYIKVLSKPDEGTTFSLFFLKPVRQIIDSY